MDIGVISMRYARALLKSATDQKQEDIDHDQQNDLVCEALQNEALTI